MNTRTDAPIYDAIEVASLLEISWDKQELARLPIPPPRVPGYVTFFDPGWSILQLREAVAGKGRILYPQDWYDNEPFAKLIEPPCYRQLRIEAIPDSFGKTVAEWRELVPPDEEIPTARVVLMGMIIHFLATDDRLFPKSFVCCIDQRSDGRRVYVGDFDSGGLRVCYHCWKEYRDGEVGVAAIRKF